MNSDSGPVDFPFEQFSDKERVRLERTWAEGGMRRYVTWIVDFAQRNREQILAAARDPRDPIALLVATKGVMLSHATLNQRGEMEDQAKEIEREIWFRGEAGDYDRVRIQIEWVLRHGPAWRRWRVREYLFATEKRSDKLADVLLRWKPGEGATGGGPVS